MHLSPSELKLPSSVFEGLWFAIVVAGLRAATFVAALFYLFNFVPLGVYALKRMTRGRRVPFSALMALGMILLPVGLFFLTGSRVLGIFFGISPLVPFEAWDAGGRILGYTTLMACMWIQGYARAAANGRPQAAAVSLIILTLAAILYGYLAYAMPVDLSPFGDKY
jgi:uncharacterized membrane protein